jgi:elongation factor G
MLDAVVDFLPARSTSLHQGWRPNLKGGDPRAQGPTSEPFSALAFKIVADPFGKLTYFRVYSGQINKGDEVLQQHARSARSVVAASC